MTVLAAALAVPAVAFALSEDNDGTLSVRAGIGRVSLTFDGSAVGRVRSGSIQVTDPVANDGAGFEFSNCDVVINKSDTTLAKGDSIKVCRGANIRFRAVGGKYVISIKGAGIYLSAVGHGSAFLNGAGDNPDVVLDGTYSLNDGPYKSLPDFGAPVILAAPTGG